MGVLGPTQTLDSRHLAGAPLVLIPLMSNKKKLYKNRPLEAMMVDMKRQAELVFHSLYNPTEKKLS
jgi:hypothetical protein